MKENNELEEDIFSFYGKLLKKVPIPVLAVPFGILLSFTCFAFVKWSLSPFETLNLRIGFLASIPFSIWASGVFLYISGWGDDGDEK
ncbi:hypothetical protein [Leptospira ilyithenensis]|uniref:Uncharacterized protein n=1 Tax=Leptospira ilyithenensis TaxID=2484901 RepID=A0A4R9LSA4_9LEPT|nr:hypothetical protein [Leptospira ilyithenensis]TGN09776.1 hypothetical protein EHS11_11885 [Leptospira ilyithenensis]